MLIKPSDISKQLSETNMLNASDTASRNIIIFTGRLLPYSETFIRAQGEGLHKFTPYYVGNRRIKGLPLPTERTFVINQGGWLGNAREGLFKLLGFAPDAVNQLKQVDAALIHAHFGMFGAIALPLARALSSPLIVTFHGNDVTKKDKNAKDASLSSRIYFYRQEALKRETKLFIAVSEFIKQKLLEKGFPAEKVLVHYIGVDTQIFQPDQAISREPVVLFVGRLVEKKGCHYLIQAMAKVQAAMPDAELVIIGDGAIKPELETIAAQSLSRYQFLGVQPPEVVKNWMNRATLLAAPSVTAESGDSEGLPIVILEAMAMGLPVVGSIHAGIPEAVIHGETGFLAPERDWANLAEHMLGVLNDPLLWQRLSVSGQKRVREKFDLDKQTRVLEDIYEAVLKKEIDDR